MMEFIIVIVLILATLHFLHDVIYNKPIINNEINIVELKKWMNAQEDINKDMSQIIKLTDVYFDQIKEKHNGLSVYTRKSMAILLYEFEKLYKEQYRCKTQKMRQFASIRNNFKKTRSRNSISLIGVSVGK